LGNDDTRRNILEAAGEVFAERGYLAATIREICKQAGVNLASVNYHFGDKQGLYAEAIRHAHQMRARQVPMPHWPAGTPAAQRLRDFVATMMRRLIGTQQMPWQWQLMIRELLQPTGACRDLVEDYIRPHFEVLLSIIDELVPEGTPLHRRQKLAFTVVGQCLYYRMSDVVIRALIPQDELNHEFDLEDLSDHVADVTLAALGVRPLFQPQAEPSV